MRSVAAKTSATLKITVAAEATTEPQSNPRKTPKLECRRDQAIGPAMTAKQMTAVTVAMTGSQIIWRSCRRSLKDALRTALPFGFFATSRPSLVHRRLAVPIAAHRRDRVEEARGGAPSEVRRVARGA